MKNLKKSFLAILILTLVLACTAYAAPQPVFGDRDVITIIVPFSAGGGYDNVARLVQPYFEKSLREITGTRVSIIVENVTGAGGVTGYARMYSSAPDGKTLGVVGMSAAPYQQMTTNAFDLNKFCYIGQYNYDNQILMVAADSKLNNLRDLINKSHELSILFGTSGQGGSEHMDTQILDTILKENGLELNMDFVHYTGTSEAMLGVIKGEVDALLVSEGTAYSYVTNGESKALVSISMERGGFLVDVPSLVDEGIPGAERLSAGIMQARVLVAPPGTPQEKIDVLEQAFLKALSDPALLQTAKSAGVNINPRNSKSAAEMTRERVELLKNYEFLLKSTK